MNDVQSIRALHAEPTVLWPDKTRTRAGQRRTRWLLWVYIVTKTNDSAPDNFRESLPDNVRTCTVAVTLT